MRHLLWVCAGGALGSGARYLLALATTRWVGASVPLGTLLANALGSLLLCALFELFSGVAVGSTGLRLALTTGLMGGFTTYSTFNFELVRFLQVGDYVHAVVYLLGTVVLCLLGGIFGIGLVRWMAL